MIMVQIQNVLNVDRNCCGKIVLERGISEAKLRVEYGRKLKASQRVS